jgi:hypothetical protein
MRSRKHKTPGDLTEARRALDRWRATRTQRAIPEPLWASAVSLAREHGVHRTARALRLNYERLRQRVTARESMALATKPLRDGASTLVEVVHGVMPAASGPTEGECVIELENARGDRARVRARGVPDVTGLAATLWGHASR